MANEQDPRTVEEAAKQAVADLGFDPDLLRQKYREERDRRLREDGNDQYIEVKGQFSHYIEDPYLDEVIEREPVTDEVEVAIIGGGFGGLLAGARLREAGLEDIRMIEKAGEFGGTWYWNRYPGARFDSESYTYGYSFNNEILQEWDWSEHFAGQPETLDELRALLQGR